MVNPNKRAKLLILAAAFVLWLMLANIMGASATYIDIEQASVSLTGFTSSRWLQTTQSDFSYNACVHVDIDRQPGDVILSARMEFLYAFQGGNSRTFWRYNTSTGTWTTMANAPGQLREDGSALASDGARYLYAIQGGTRAFWRYDAVSNSWTTMARSPGNVKLGGGLAYNGNGEFYALRGDADTGFWRYSVDSDMWTVLANTPLAVSDGGCLVSDHRNFVYAMQGNGQRAFWRYNTTSNTWSSMATIPYPVRYGGAMTYDGNDSIYALTGWSQAYFLKYSISENRWYRLSNIPRFVSYGGSLAFSYPEAIFAFSGGGTARYYRYDVVNATWSSVAYAPGNVDAGGSLSNGAFVFFQSGTLTSITYDTAIEGCKFQGLFWNETLAVGTDITFDMRASDTLISGEPKADWTYLGGTSPLIASLPSGRYVQWRATLTTSNIHLTPVLQEVRVYYA
jgi:hypothetical protein